MPDRGWSAIRYRFLLPAAAASLRCGAVYASFVGAVEWARDPARRHAASARIERWLGVPASTARRVYRLSLESEAREEADSAFFMRQPAAFDALVAPPITLAASRGATIYAGLHLGSPVLGYLYLGCRVAPELALVGRALDEANPLADAKRRFAARKVAWTERRAGRPFFPTDPAAMLRVRAHLRAGRPLYMLADVPGDAVGRSASCRLFGETVRLAAGLPTLARIAASAVQTVAVTRGRDGLAVHAGPLIPPEAVDLPTVLEALAPFIRRYPEQWWMWPYLPAGSPGD